MRNMWGCRWRGPQEENEDGQDEESLVDQVEYAQWIAWTTRRMEEILQDRGNKGRWEEEAMSRKYGWAGHMIRRGPGRRTTRMVAMEETSRKRIRKGRPITRWADSFRKWFEMGGRRKR